MIPFRRHILLIFFLILLSFVQVLAQDKKLPADPSLDSISEILLSNMDSTFFYFSIFNDSLINDFIETSKTYNLPLKEINLLFHVSVAFFQQSKYSDAQNIFQEIIAKGNLETDWKIIAGSHNYLSLIATFNKDYMEVYYHNKKLYEFGEKYSPLWHALMSLNLGAFYMSMDDLAMAEQMYRNGISIFEKVPKQTEYGWLLHRLGELQIAKGNLSEAEPLLLKALDYWERTNDARAKSFTLCKLGVLFVAKKDTIKAKKHYLEGLAIAEKNEFWLSQITVLVELGGLASAQKNHQEAIQYLEKSAEISVQKNIPYYFKQGYQLLAKNYEAIGKMEAANKNYQDYFQQLEKTVKLNQSTTKDWAKKLDQLTAKEQAYNLLKETERINQEKLKLQQIIIAAGILITTMALWLAYSYFKTNQRNAQQKEKLEVLNQKIREQANQLAIANTHITHKKKDLEIDLVKKLMALSTHSETIKSIEHTLGKMNISKESLEIKKLIDTTKNDTFWKELDIQVTQSNADFFKKLAKKHPNLTPGDLRLSALLKMNLSTKEIANLTFKNPASVKVARSRLRKKLGLTNSNADLSCFLNQI